MKSNRFLKEERQVDRVGKFENSTYFQEEIFLIPANLTVSKKIRLNPDYKYCIGLYIIPSRSGLFGIKDNGKIILDKVPLKHIEGETVKNIKHSFFNINMNAAGSLKTLDFENFADLNNHVRVVFLLSNNALDFKNKRHETNIIKLKAGVNSGKFNFSLNKSVVGFKIYPINKTTSSLDIDTLTIRNRRTFFVDKIKYSIINKHNDFDVNDRLIPLKAPTDELQYEIVTSRGGDDLDCFFVFEYENDKINV